MFWGGVDCGLLEFIKLWVNDGFLCGEFGFVIKDNLCEVGVIDVVLGVEDVGVEVCGGEFFYFGVGKNLVVDEFVGIEMGVVKFFKNVGGGGFVVVYVVCEFDDYVRLFLCGEKYGDWVCWIFL